MPLIEVSEMDDFKWLVDMHYNGEKIKMMEANTENLKTLMMEVCGYTQERSIEVMRKIKNEWMSIDESGLYEGRVYSQETAHEYVILYEDVIRRMREDVVDYEWRNELPVVISGTVRRRLVFDDEIEEGEIVEDDDEDYVDEDEFSYENMIDASAHFRENRIENTI
jgi:hypothetical protein